MASVGAADLDSDVDWRDYQLLEAGFGSGTTWFAVDGRCLHVTSRQRGSFIYDVTTGTIR